MISDEQIELAKSQTTYTDEIYHEHNDCIRITYQWLDAQKKIKRANPNFFDLKHLIERWGGRYVSSADVCVAAHLHPDIEGSYPEFNISSARLTEPSLERLNGVSEAMKHKDYYRYDSSVYKVKE